MQTITVSLGPRSYPIYIGSALIPTLASRIKIHHDGGKVVLVTVAPVSKLYGRVVEDGLVEVGIQPAVLVVPDREAAKSHESFMNVVGKLLEMNAGRDSIIVSLGGGCVGDLAGFVAATYMRGVKLVHLPTSLLAQVDSSIGGKAAINHPNAKNLIGTVYQPKFVLADTDLLKSLPPREVGCGMAELIKYGAILDLSLFEILEMERDAIMQFDDEQMEKIVSAAARLKADVVMKDELDHGSRMLLNFGHTVGHAIETAMAYEGYSHGEAVAVGMMAESRISMALGLMSEHDVERLGELISLYALPTRVKGIMPETILQLISHDKKVESGKLRVSIPIKLGEGRIIKDPPRETVASAIREVLED